MTGDLAPTQRSEKGVDKAPVCCVASTIEAFVGDAMSTLVRAAVLTNYFEVAAHLGLNPQPLLHRVNLSRKLLADPEQRIPLAAVITLLEESARVTGCSTFGLRMAESRQLADFGVVSLLLTHQRTLRDALLTTTEYQHLLNESLAIHIEDAGKMVILREEVVADFPTSSRQGTELAIGVLFRLCAALLGAHWRPFSVSFTHAAPADLQLHRRMFKCELEFDAEFNGIVCPAADSRSPESSGGSDHGPPCRALRRFSSRRRRAFDGARRAQGDLRRTAHGSCDHRADLHRRWV